MYKPKLPFNVPAVILMSTYEKINGVNTKIFTESETIFVSAKSYGGTEKIIDDKIMVEDTIIIETWFTPKITSNCNIRLLDDNSEWEIISPPENIDRRNQYLRFKIRRINGGA